VDASAVIERITALLDGGTNATSNTSIRIPTALRATLEAVVMQAVLDDHYRQHGQARPSPGDLAVTAHAAAASEAAHRAEGRAGQGVRRRGASAVIGLLIWGKYRHR